MDTSSHHNALNLVQMNTMHPQTEAQQTMSSRGHAGHQANNAHLDVQREAHAACRLLLGKPTTQKHEWLASPIAAGFAACVSNALLI
jgi:hypothetical protein